MKRKTPHDKYIDIKVIMGGADSMGWKPRATCQQPLDAYNPDKDVQFFEDEPDTRVLVRARQFVIFFPEDAHAPMVSDDLIHKIVIKVCLST